MSCYCTVILQVISFTAKGLSAAFASQADSTDIKEGRFQLVFITPESLIGNLQWREMLRSTVYEQNLVGVAVDEAHCVTKW